MEQGSGLCKSWPSLRAGLTLRLYPEGLGRRSRGAANTSSAKAAPQNVTQIAGSYDRKLKPLINNRVCVELYPFAMVQKTPPWGRRPASC